MNLELYNIDFSYFLSVGATLRVFGQYIVTICNSKNRVEADEACDEEIPKAEDSVHKASFIHQFSSRVDMEGWKFAKGTTLKKVLPMKQFKGVITPSRNGSSSVVSSLPVAVRE